MPYALTTDDVRLYFEEAGNGTPIIFLHEFAADHTNWEPQMRYFSGRPRRSARPKWGRHPWRDQAGCRAFERIREDTRYFTIRWRAMTQQARPIPCSAFRGGDLRSTR